MYLIVSPLQDLSVHILAFRGPRFSSDHPECFSSQVISRSRPVSYLLLASFRVSLL